MLRAVPAFPLWREELEPTSLEAEDVRGAVLEAVGLQVQLKGQPLPRLWIVGYEGCSVLDLDPVARQDPGASVAATLAEQLEQPDTRHVFLVIRLQGEDREGVEQSAACVVGRSADSPGWWVATLAYTVDRATGLGRPAAQWGVGEAEDDADLPDFLRPLVTAPPDARPVRTLPARPRPPDIQAAFGDLPAQMALPTGAEGQAELTAALVTQEICRQGITGVMVLRTRGHAWEQWLLGEGLPAGLDDMIRYIASRETAAEGIALVQVALFEDGRPGIQIVAERNGDRAECRVYLEFPNGPGGEKVPRDVRWRTLSPPPEGEGWIGVDPMVEFELGPLSGADA
jgi:hypothetical protein